MSKAVRLYVLLLRVRPTRQNRSARLRAGDSEDHIPFFVRPPKGEASASIAFLAPTNSYLAYANEQLTDLPPELFPNQKQGAPSPDDQYAIENGLLSPYDHHTDGSRVCYSTRLRPILNMRPRYHMRALNCPHQFPADSHLIDWLEQQDQNCDVITDENLHYDNTVSRITGNALRRFSSHEPRP